jgi:hypothetical protein
VPRRSKRISAVRRPRGVEAVAVVAHEGNRRIKLNNFYVLGGTAAAGDERLQGHIPLLLHPRPERVAFLGLGTVIHDYLQ